jgi:hypothetical protein
MSFLPVRRFEAAPDLEENSMNTKLIHLLGLMAIPAVAQTPAPVAPPAKSEPAAAKPAAEPAKPPEKPQPAKPTTEKHEELKTQATDVAVDAGTPVHKRAKKSNAPK